MRGQIGNNFSRPRFPVNLHQGLYLYVLDKPRVDYTLARGPLKRGAQLGTISVGPGLYLYVLDKPRVDYTLAWGPLRRGAQLGAIGPIGLRPALVGVILHIQLLLFQNSEIFKCTQNNSYLIRTADSEIRIQTKPVLLL